MRIEKMNNAVKAILAALFFICLIELPYGFYQFVRLIGLIGFGILAYQASGQERKTEMTIFIGLALLFQPFYKIALGRQLWNLVDLAVGLGLLASIFISPKSNNSK